MSDSGRCAATRAATSADIRPFRRRGNADCDSRDVSQLEQWADRGFQVRCSRLTPTFAAGLEGALARCLPPGGLKQQGHGTFHPAHLAMREPGRRFDLYSDAMNPRRAVVRVADASRG